VDESGGCPHGRLEGGGGDEDAAVVGGVLDRQGGGEIFGEAGTVGSDGAEEGAGFRVALAAAVAAEAEAGESVGGGHGGEDGVAGGDVAGLIAVLFGSVFGEVEIGPGETGFAGGVARAAGRLAGHAASRRSASSRRPARWMPSRRHSPMTGSPASTARRRSAGVVTNQAARLPVAAATRSPLAKSWSSQLSSSSSRGVSGRMTRRSRSLVVSPSPRAAEPNNDTCSGR